MKKLILSLFVTACTFSLIASDGECPAKKSCGDKPKSECPAKKGDCDKCKDGKGCKDKEGCPMGKKDGKGGCPMEKNGGKDKKS
jgi:hypothetical protein